MADFYFRHDFGACHDMKIIALRMEMDWAGYGLYWALIERLASSSDHKLRFSDINNIAWDLRADAGDLKRVITKYGLFILADDGSSFYSDRLVRDLESLDDKREFFSALGKKGGDARWKGKKNEVVSNEDSDAIAAMMAANSTLIAANSGYNSPPIAANSLIDKIRIDKNREDKNRINASCAELTELDAGSGVKPSCASEELTDFALPLNTGEDWYVPLADLTLWRETYPAVDVEQELRAMRAWALANKSRRKTARGIKAFVVTWLSKEQDAPKRSPLGLPRQAPRAKDAGLSTEGITYGL